MKNPVFIVGVIPTGSVLPLLEYELRNSGGEWGKWCFSLEHFPDLEIEELMDDVKTQKNMFIRTDIKNGAFLRNQALLHGWKMLEVVVLPSDISTLYRGNITDDLKLKYEQEVVELLADKSFSKTIYFTDGKSCAQELLALWSVVNESLV